MRYTRIYANADGESHFRDVEFEGTTEEDGASILADTEASQAMVVRFAPDYRQDWHRSPVPTLCVVLVGEAFFTASDGQTRRFGAGSIVITDDVTGKGHVTGATTNGSTLLVLRLSGEKSQLSDA